MSDSKGNNQTHRNGDIAISNLSHAFGSELVLNQIEHRFASGTLAAILGPSGCGKTTLLRILAGLLKSNSGSVMLDGIEPEVARKKGEVGFAFQAPTLLPWRTALENVLLPLEILGKSKEPKERAHARELLEMVDLSEEEDKLPSILSGGMQQRVGLARSLVTHPSFLFLDEPFGALDGITRDRLNEKVRQLWSRYNLTIIFVTHSVEEAIFLAESVIILTERPARKLETIDIKLGEARDFRTRARNEFFEYQKTIRRITEGLP